MLHHVRSVQEVVVIDRANVYPLIYPSSTTRHDHSLRLPALWLWWWR